MHFSLLYSSTPETSPPPVQWCTQRTEGGHGPHTQKNELLCIIEKSLATVKLSKYGKLSQLGCVPFPMKLVI